MTRPRTPGRPTGDTQAQRERLLDAAVDHFAQNGIRATSLRTIAESAGVTPALVNYYFGNKQSLVEAVFTERIRPLISSVASRVQDAGDDLHGMVASLVDGLNQNLARHPWLPPLWVREVLCEGGALRELWTQQIGPMIPVMLAARFTKAQARHALNPDLNPQLLVVSLFALIMLPHAAASVLHNVFPDTDLRNAALTEHTLALLERGMEIFDER